MASLYRTLLLSTTPLTKVPIFECACVLYRNYNTTPIIAPSNPFVRSTGSKRYTIMNLLFEFLAHHLKWSRVATCKWNHKCRCASQSFWFCNLVINFVPLQFECVANLRSPELLQSLFTWQASCWFNHLLQACNHPKTTSPTYSSSVSLHCLGAAMFPSFFQVLHQT